MVVWDFVEKGLTQSCTADDQCVTPFAECYQGKCACREGFSYSDGMCLPKEYYCAQGREPLRARDSIHYCTLYNDGRDTCPNGSYCVPLTKWQTSSLCKVTAKVRGFCCSIPNDTESVRTACPVGRPLPDLANCRQSSTHYMYVSKYAINKPLCCPNPCPQQYLYHDKRCIRNRLGPGSNCEIDLQCTCGYCRRQQDGAPSCFYGNASIDEVSKAPKTCSKANPQCPKDFICYAEFGLCCPRMPIMGMQ
ncbi:EB domain containing protein [Trichuris trichiura]|uniref:EB domain containing protein n=1 Tax=Trichuris trichiura TaxID=36087 RepID=A0A077ZJW9_TRITR|nr:EB domain containing protein [Trichuris trichiura]